MQFEESLIISANSEQIYSLYKDVSGWSQWDPETESAEMNGEFRLGATGEIKPKGAPKSKIELIEVTENQSFTVQSKLPLCKMHFIHILEPHAEGTRVVNRVVFSGALSPVFGRLIGSGIKKGLPSVLQGLKSHVEST